MKKIGSLFCSSIIICLYSWGKRCRYCAVSPYSRVIQQTRSLCPLLNLSLCFSLVEIVVWIYRLLYTGVEWKSVWCDICFLHCPLVLWHHAQCWCDGRRGGCCPLVPLWGVNAGAAHSDYQLGFWMFRLFFMRREMNVDYCIELWIVFFGSN